MKPEDRSLRIGAAVVAGALLIRLLGGGLTDRLISFFSDPEVAAAILLLETGRVVRMPTEDDPVSPADTEPSPVTPPLAEKIIPCFTAEDTGLVQINNASSCTVSLEDWLLSPLELSLTESEPTVLILHTHTSESYTGSDPATYRTQDENKNMLAVGQALAQRLQAAGISVLHDRTVHDYPSYNGSYTQARSTIKAYLDQHPSIQLVLDLHRDAMTDDAGNQIGTTALVNGEKAAKLMMVVGSNAGGLHHPGWQENMSLAVKLHAQLEMAHPGICRPISFRSQRFNQDLSAGAMLIEVGAAGNTLPEALNAVNILADAIIALSHGANH